MDGGSCQARARRVESRAGVVPLYMVEQRLEPGSGALEPFVTQPAHCHSWDAHRHNGWHALSRRGGVGSGGRHPGSPWGAV